MLLLHLEYIIKFYRIFFIFEGYWYARVFDFCNATVNNYKKPLTILILFFLIKVNVILGESGSFHFYFLIIIVIKMLIINAAQTT